MKRILAFAVAAAVLAGLGLLSRSDAAQPAGWGTVKGRIVWSGGDIPEPKVLPVDKDKEHCLSKGNIVSENWVINPKNKGVRYVFVWLAPIEKKGKMPIHPALEKVKDKEVFMDQPCCKFVPHAVGVRKGQQLVAKNTGQVAHNFHWTGFGGIGGNVQIPPGQSFTVANLKPSDYAVEVKCDSHTWMKGWVRVFDHPYFTVTDADGKFEIKNAPAGKYRLMVWHEEGWVNGRQGQIIDIPAGKELDAGEIKAKPAK